MKRKAILLLCLILLVVSINVIAEETVFLLGGYTMDSAIELKNEHWGKEIIGHYENKGLKGDTAQSKGWYSFQIPQNGKCTVRVKTYGESANTFTLMNKNGERLEKQFLKPDDPWMSYSFNALAGEKYYLFFERHILLQWGCMFSVCVEGHHKVSSGERVIQDASCVQQGMTGYQCELCAENIISGTIPPKGHQPGIERIIKEANCLQKGEKGVLCSVCNAVISSVEIPMQGHTPGAYVDVQKATCTADGVRAQYCQVCNATLNTEKTTAFGHQSGEWRTVAVETCYQAGRREKNCVTCGAILAVEEIPQEEHQYSEWKTILEPTKEAEGEQGRMCILCGDVQINKIPKVEKFLGIF